MKKNDEVICNVCGISSKDEKDAVFIQAIKGGESVDICTSCMPTVIHGSGSVVRSNESIAAELGK
ncbi:hypothetical protein [Campylobacter sp. 19-13652]|uniref:hypothetical protein n=1 Tax=Campylobacter sp. 19-13652 TaxID=2840180 RepID=UPI001C781B45|nr:hypothetical protein [Campylobacter sp. 19-13652]BCX80071.1 hypothetical protein LBC_15330 [Campylobacter sp. 19-13652]